MSDVRLTATNPDDSSVIPVACNARGELLTVAPVIEKIPNDVEIEGDLTVTGTINGDSGGSGLPAPGPEGSILAIENGAPAWVGKSDLCAPPPPELIITPGIATDSTNQYSMVALDSSGTKQEWVTDFNAYLKTCDGWAAQPEVTPGQAGLGMNNSRLSKVMYNVEVKDLLSKVCHMGWYAYSTRNPAIEASSKLQVEIADPQGVVFINDTVSGVNDINNQSTEFLGTTTCFFNRDNFQFEMSAQLSGSYLYIPQGPILRWFAIEDAEAYLMRKHIQQKQRIEQLESRLLTEVGSTTDIDL